MPNRQTEKSRSTVSCLGAAGEMGETLARYLSQSKRIGKLILADRNAEGAARVASQLSGTATCEVVNKTVDILDEKSLKDLLSEIDFIANAAGPFFRLGVSVLKRAIETRTPYLDICDDPETTLEMLALDSDARTAGVGALIGMGASPGVLNLMARRAANRLDEIVDCYTVWPLDTETPLDRDTPTPPSQDTAVSAAVIHLMEQISGMVDGVVNGKCIKVKPLEPIALTYPGLGEGTAVTVGHPEPITLHQSLGVKRRSANLMLVTRSTEQYLQGIARDIDAGRLTLEEAASAVLHPRALRSAKAFISSFRSKGPGNLPPFFALVVGAKDGVRKAVGCHATTMPPGMDGATSIPAAIAVDMLLENPTKPGVHAPESVIDGDILLDRLRPYCPESPPSVEELAPLSEIEIS